MTAAEAQAELELIRAARARLLAGGVASYAIGGRSITYLSLRDLNEREKELEMVIASETGGRTVLARFRRP